MSAGVQTKVQANPAQSFTPAGTGILQRKCTLCNTPGLVEDSERDEELILQRSPVDRAEPSAVPPIVHEVLRSPGQPLDPETRAFMEPRFGHDFSRVSVLGNAPAMIQAKLTISQPNDRYEQEANRVANDVMWMTEPEMQRQRDEQHAQQVMRHLQAEKGSGHPIDTETRTEMETAFGQDFSKVRVHTGAMANKLAKELEAKAFTSGRDIFFKEGAYRPSSEAGRRLIGHELTHVVQQESITRAGQVYASQVDDAFEQQAERTAEKVVHDQNASLKAIGVPPTIQRFNEEGWSPYRRGGAPGITWSPFYTPVRAPQPNIEEVVRGLLLQVVPGSFSHWFLSHYDSLLSTYNPPRVGEDIRGVTQESTFIRPDTPEIRELTEIYLSLETFSTEDVTYFVNQRERLQVTVNIWGAVYQTAEEQREVGASSINLSFQNRNEYQIFSSLMSLRPPEIQIPGAMARWGRF